MDSLAAAGDVAFADGGRPASHAGNSVNRAFRKGASGSAPRHAIILFVPHGSARWAIVLFRMPNRQQLLSTLVMVFPQIFSRAKP